MYLLRSDELQMISSFLSLHDRISFRITAKSFKSSMRNQDVSLYKIEKNIHKSFYLMTKPTTDLILAVNNNFIMYIDQLYMNKLGRVHPLFRIPHTAPSCVNDCCREKRLEYIYIGVYTSEIPRYLRCNYYIRRYIPYCICCFNKWNVDAYLYHPQRKKFGP